MGLTCAQGHSTMRIHDPSHAASLNSWTHKSGQKSRSSVTRLRGVESSAQCGLQVVDVRFKRAAARSRSVAELRIIVPRELQADRSGICGP
jgi:methyl coenzyme M reductase gamma subunit